MTEDERKLLSDLADRIANTPSPAKDPDAEQFIRTRIGARPDALYLMTQTVVIQNIALQQAQAQIQQLQQSAGGQSGQLGAPGSFIGQGQGQAPRQGYAPQYGGQYAPPPPSYAAPTPAAPSPSIGGAGGGFLRGAAQTAAGVAAGALAFEGISSLFHHGMGGGFGGGGGLFGGGGIGGYAPPMDETVVNNYYEGGQGGGNNFDDRGGNQGRDDYQAADDAGTNAPDPGYDDSANQFDDNSGGGFDDGGGGGFDDGSGGGDNFA